jgi:hypothetical protein
MRLSALSTRGPTAITGKPCRVQSLGRTDVADGLVGRIVDHAPENALRTRSILSMRIMGALDPACYLRIVAVEVILSDFRVLRGIEHIPEATLSSCCCHSKLPPGAGSFAR